MSLGRIRKVEKIVAHLKTQGAPEYLSAITEDEPVDEEDEGGGPLPTPGSMDAEEAGDYYDRAVNIVLRDRKCSTSYIQRRLSVGYNKAASLVERANAWIAEHQVEVINIESLSTFGSGDDTSVSHWYSGIRVWYRVQ